MLAHSYTARITQAQHLLPPISIVPSFISPPQFSFIHLPFSV
jgi:hypothetical protein